MNIGYNYELIEDFLDGIVDLATAKEIRRLLETDEVARDIAKGILILKEHFGEGENIEKYMDERLAQAEMEIAKNTSAQKSSSILKIAASIVFVVASGLALYQLSKSNLEGLVADQLETPYEASVALRGANSSTALQGALAAYNDGQYQGAFDLLKSENSAQATFFSGLSLLYLDQNAEAITHLKSTELIGSRYEEQSKWYLSLAYLKSDKLDQGEKLLLRIKFTKSHFKQKEAIEILEFLND